jgi:hypothetical protein
LNQPSLCKDHGWSGKDLVVTVALAGMDFSRLASAGSSCATEPSMEKLSSAIFYFIVEAFFARLQKPLFTQQSGVVVFLELND